MADALHQHSAGHHMSAYAHRNRNPLLENNELQQIAADMAQRTTGVRPQPRKRGRPRKIRDPEEEKRDENTKRRRARVPIVDVDRPRIVAWHNDGKSYAEIGRLLGYNADAVGKFVRLYKTTGRMHPITHKQRACGANRVKHTLEMKLVVVALFLLEPEMTQKKAMEIAKCEFNVNFSQSAIRKMLKDARFSLKSLVVRKVSWNTPATLQSRQGYPEFIRAMQARFRLLYYDEQNYNVHMHRSRGWSTMTLSVRLVVVVPLSLPRNHVVTVGSHLPTSLPEVS